MNEEIEKTEELEGGLKMNAGGTITLRPISTADTDFMVRLANAPETTKYVPGLIRERSMMEEWITGLGPDDHEFIVLLDSTPIGECSLTMSENTTEIGFMLLPAYWRQGYGTEIVHQLLELAASLGVEDITAVTDRNNEAAIRMLEKAGFVRQTIGWMLQIGEDEEDALGQTIVQYRKQLTDLLKTAQ